MTQVSYEKLSIVKKLLKFPCWQKEKNKHVQWSENTPNNIALQSMPSSTRVLTFTIDSLIKKSYFISEKTQLEVIMYM